jgi:hypothetical protein
MHRALGCAHATATFHLHRLRPRLSGESGQGTVEYVGLILLIAGLMVAVLAAKSGGTDLGKQIVGKLKDSIDGVGATKGGG